MQFSIRDVLLFPLIALATMPICHTASAIGLWILPWFVVEWPNTLEWFLDCGLSEDFVCSELTFFWSDIPSILTLVVLAFAMFLHRTRLCDQLAVISFAALPFVEALQIDALAGDFHTPNLGWQYLGTQSFTAGVLAAIIAIYVFARWRMPNPTPTRLRSIVSTATLSLVLAASVGVWQDVT